MNRFALFVSSMCILIACADTDQPNKFADPVHIKVADFQDKRLSDSLYQYFAHENAHYRKAAVLAFASIQDTLAIEGLSEVLAHDHDASVRSAAAFALGQLNSPRSAFALLNNLANEKDSSVLIEMLEAYGKTTNKWNLDPNQKPIEGVARSFYRSVLRNKIDSTYYSHAFSFLSPANNENTRLHGSHFFARLPKINSALEEKLISAEAAYTTGSDGRMALTLALRKCKSDSALSKIEKTLATIADGRVKANAIRSLQPFSFNKTKSLLINSLHNTDINVGVAASEVIKAVITENEWKEIVEEARTTKNFRIQANLYDAALTISNQKELAEEIMSKVKSTSGPYQKAALITALQSSLLSADFVFQQLIATDTPVVRSSAATALVEMNTAKNFDKDLTQTFAHYYQRAIETGDAAVIGIIAQALGDSTLGYKSILTDFTFLKEAKAKLTLHKDNEALVPLENALAYFENRKPAEIKNEFNNPIDWELVKTISKDQQVLVKTTKGDIIMLLFVEEAPGSVANFVKLIQQQYFNGKFFHRVVPNFVVQAGCNRGDGWGSEDYSIRSEFTQRRYKTGSVGMASSGKDTEGTQWFITHSPTPHLDGRYTIFAEVLTGMEVVHQIEVGDQIVSVSLK